MSGRWDIPIWETLMQNFDIIFVNLMEEQTNGKTNTIWTASSEFGTYRICEQRRFRRACASAQSRQNLRCSLIQAVNKEEPSDRKPDPWPLWMAGHAQLKFVMTECSKTQIGLTGLIYPRHKWLVIWMFNFDLLPQLLYDFNDIFTKMKIFMFTCWN